MARSYAQRSPPSSYPLLEGPLKQRLPIFYTLLETAKLVGVDPARYLREAALADARGEILLSHEFAAVTAS
ncbi:MAG: hypothetical protein U0270_17735 [Labilithrix sp.]